MQPAKPVPKDDKQAHVCPWCGASNTDYVQRGYTGPTDESDQYFTCNSCHKVTYQLISRTTRQTRLGRYRVGGIFKDSKHQTKYRITRMLKVGFDEYLLHLKPIPGDDDSDSA